ncbi:hypothetical protein [Christensenella intestinihominis]|uniref:hypothetical protein n=1 Tax=Christensenella intestinihominis TaxID=1851429 RepID=UPI0012EA58F3|nr:hypothetical protein [Christensenella intestinihominis]
METTRKTKSTPHKDVEKKTSKYADGSKKVEKTTAKKKLDGSTKVTHKVEAK